MPEMHTLMFYEGIAESWKQLRDGQRGAGTCARVSKLHFILKPFL
jgi:hypothetical protein